MDDVGNNGAISSSLLDSSNSASISKKDLLALKHIFQHSLGPFNELENTEEDTLTCNNPMSMFTFKLKKILKEGR